MITQQEILQFKAHGSWRERVALAAEIAADAERHAGGASMNPLMGGGTRLMLPLDRLALLFASVEKLSVLPQAATQWQAIRVVDPPALPEAIVWAKAELQFLAERVDRRMEAAEIRHL